MCLWQQRLVVSKSVSEIRNPDIGVKTLEKKFYVKIKIPRKGFQRTTDLVKTLKLWTTQLHKKVQKQHRTGPVLYYVDQMSAPYMANQRMSFTPEFSNRALLVFSKEPLIDQGEIVLIRKRM